MLCLLSVIASLPANLFRRLDDSLNQSLYKVKQLEGRLQMTEISNRALLEEVIRLQTELFNAVRRCHVNVALFLLLLQIRQSQNILQEERLSRQQIENNVRIQNDVILQLTARIKRNEDTFSDQHQSTLSFNANVRGLEQQMGAIQREYLFRRDNRSSRFVDAIDRFDRTPHASCTSSDSSVDGFRRQIDDNTIQREQLEKVQMSTADELRSIRARLEIDSANLNALTNEVRQRTRKIEDDHRMTVEDPPKRRMVSRPEKYF